MNICFFALEHHALGAAGGIASYLEALTVGMEGLGHEIHVIVKGTRQRDLKLERGGFLHEFKGSNLHWYISKLPLLGKVLSLTVRELEWSWGFYRKFRYLQKRYRFDLIESSETGNLFVSLFEKSIPLVIRLHGSTYSFEKSTRGAASFGPKLDRILQRISFRKASGISAPSEFQKRMFDSELSNFSNVAVIPNPVMEHLSPSAGQINQDGSNGHKMVFYAGRIADVKGVWPLLEAFVEVAEKRSDALLLMAGSPHVSISRDDIDSFIKSHNLSDKVRFLGHVPREKIPEYYKACTLCVVPSYYETFCITAAEALLHGKPVVASSGTSLEEIVEDGKTGFLVPSGNAGALAEAIMKVLSDEELAERMGYAGRENALARFSAAKIVLETVSFYLTLVSGSNNRHRTLS